MRHVSNPYNNTGLTFGLNKRTLAAVPISLGVHAFFSILNAACFHISVCSPLSVHFIAQIGERLIFLLLLSFKCDWLIGGSHFFVTEVMIQFIAKRNRKGDRRHTCLTPVLTWNFFVNCSSWITLHSNPFRSFESGLQTSWVHHYNVEAASIICPCLGCQMLSRSRQNWRKVLWRSFIQFTIPL